MSGFGKGLIRDISAKQVTSIQNVRSIHPSKFPLGDQYSISDSDIFLPLIFIFFPLCGDVKMIPFDHGM